MVFDVQHIRPIAVGVIKHENKILAMKAYDSCKKQTFYRLLGGGIEFGEKAEDTVCREFKEELGVEVCVVRRLGVEENIFVYEGRCGHEIAFFFELAFKYKEDYGREFSFREKSLKDVQPVWVSVDTKDPIYPNGAKKFCS